MIFIWLALSLDFRGYAAAFSRARRRMLISSGVGWSGRDALNLAAMMAPQSLAAMSAVDGWSCWRTRGRRSRDGGAVRLWRPGAIWTGLYQGASTLTRNRSALRDVDVSSGCGSRGDLRRRRRYEDLLGGSLIRKAKAYRGALDAGLPGRPG